MVTYGSLHRGFEYPLQGFVCIAENDIFTEKKRKKVKKKEYDGKNIAGFNELILAIMLFMRIRYRPVQGH